MANQVKKEAPEVEEQVHIDEFLKGIEDGSATLRHMFRHFTAEVGGVTHKSAREFKTLWEKFKNLPASKLK